MAQKIAKRVPDPDSRYSSVGVAKLINQIMKKGKKSVARRVVYGAFDIIQEKTKKDALEVFTKAMENVSPLVEVRSKRVGGATYQVPVEVPQGRKDSLALRWIIGAAGSKKGRPMKDKLAEEIIAAFKNEGSAVKKREDVHRMAEANRAFAHFAW